MQNFYGPEFIEFFKKLIPGSRAAAGNTEILCRCRYCGDSKDPKKAHMYISVPQDNTEISLYHCKKCGDVPGSGSRGIVDVNFIRLYDCTDASMYIALAARNNEILKLPKYKTLKSIDIYPLRYEMISNGLNNNAKLDYINSRIGSNFTLADMIKLKIAINLYDILNANRLELTRDKWVTDNLNDDFIGFISYDNSFINMRKVLESNSNFKVDRYLNYNLIKKIDNSKNYYIMKTNYNILSIAPIKIHIAEGPFDILSIYHNLNNCNDMDNIYVACGGKGYLSSLIFILVELGLINYEVHYYVDKDVNDNEFAFTLQVVSQLPCHIYVHRNVFPGEKDYGVPMNKITDHSSRVR